MTVIAKAVAFIPPDPDASSLGPSCGFSVVEASVGVVGWFERLEVLFLFSVVIVGVVSELVV